MVKKYGKRITDLVGGEYGKRLNDLAFKYNLICMGKAGNGHVRLEHEEIDGIVVFCSSTPSDTNAIHAVERSIKKAFVRAGFTPDGNRIQSDNDNASPKICRNPFSHLPKTTPDIRRDRRAEFQNAALQQRPPAFVRAGQSGSFSDYVLIERHLDVA